MLRDKIKEDFKKAFKSGDKVRLSVLKMVQSEIGNAEINKRAKLMKDLPVGQAGGKAENIEIAAFLNDDEVFCKLFREIKKERFRGNVRESGQGGIGGKRKSGTSGFGGVSAGAIAGRENQRAG